MVGEGLIGGDRVIEDGGVVEGRSLNVNGEGEEIETGKPDLLPKNGLSCFFTMNPVIARPYQI